jgi:hypothetical protein
VDIVMHLIHRTNYWGSTITWSDRDVEVDGMDAIWVQVVDEHWRSCCRGFGKRSVRVDMEDLTNHHSGRWNLFYVSGTEGRNSDHYFHKLVLIPQGTRGFGKTGCAKRGWTFVGKWTADAQSSAANLSNLLRAYKSESGFEVCHVHLGLHMPSYWAGKGNSY